MKTAEKPKRGRPRTAPRVTALARLLDRLGISHSEFARMIRVSQQTANGYARGKRPEGPVADRIVAAFPGAITYDDLYAPKRRRAA